MFILCTVILSVLSLGQAEPIGPVDMSGSSWGDWGQWRYCPPGEIARSFRVKSESYGGALIDDTALNIIQLRCEGGDLISSYEGQFGDWSDEKFCPDNAVLQGFRLLVEEDQGASDDTSANNIQIRCSNGVELDGGAKTNFGEWSPWQTCASGYGFCGIKTRVEEPRNPRAADDTSLNNVQFECCRF